MSGHKRGPKPKLDLVQVGMSHEMQRLALERTGHLVRLGRDNTIHQLCILGYLQGAYDMAYATKGMEEKIEMAVATARRFRKKAVVIDAIRFTPENIEECVTFCAISVSATGGQFSFGRDKTGSVAIVIHTLEGDMVASENDWIIRGIKGELYPCKPDIFEATYELAE